MSIKKPVEKGMEIEETEEPISEQAFDKHIGFDDEEVLRKRVLRRIQQVSGYLSGIGLKKFYVAGGALSIATPRDIDIFFEKEELFPNIPTKDIVSKTRNAVTVNQQDCVIQFCRYFKPTLEELVSSFDFSHVKQGAVVELLPEVMVSKIYVHPDRYRAGVIGSGYYTGGEYPLSSLLRLFKYWQRGEISNEFRTWSMVQILNGMIDRGFTSYGDFLDQLEAVDLHILPEEWEIISLKDFNKLYNLLRKLTDDESESIASAETENPSL